MISDTLKQLRPKRLSRFFGLILAFDGHFNCFELGLKNVSFLILALSKGLLKPNAKLSGLFGIHPTVIESIKHRIRPQLLYSAIKQSKPAFDACYRI